jgi:hypothetical protein
MNDVPQVYPVGCGLAVAQHRSADILASKHLDVVPEHLLPLGTVVDEFFKEIGAYAVW